MCSHVFSPGCRWATHSPQWWPKCCGCHSLNWLCDWHHSPNLVQMVHLSSCNFHCPVGRKNSVSYSSNLWCTVTLKQSGVVLCGWFVSVCHFDWVPCKAPGIRVHLPLWSWVVCPACWGTSLGFLCWMGMLEGFSRRHMEFHKQIRLHNSKVKGILHWLATNFESIQ